MDPRRNAQDVLRCDLCETPVPPMYCDICLIHLCKACVGEHLSKFTKEQKIVPFEKRGSTTKCPNHSSKICELYCEQCDIPICAQCTSSTKHQGHTFVYIMNILEKQKSVLQKDLQELEKSIYPKYQKTASSIPVQKTTSDISKHGEEMHKEIDLIIKKLKSDLDEIDSKTLAALNKHEDEIKCMLSNITQTIENLRKLIQFDDVCLVSAYKSRNAEFRRLQSKLMITLPSFYPQKVDKHQVYKQCGSFSESSIETKKHNYTLGTEHSPVEGSLIDVPRIVTEMNIDFEFSKNVSCLNDEDIWIHGNDNILKLYNRQRGLIKSMKTKSGHYAADLAVTRSGDLVYTEETNRNRIDIVKNKEIQTVITLQGWKPCGVCSTFSGDILVAMNNADWETPSKVVRYSGSTEIQSIQYNENGKALFSSNSCTKYISENRNLHICVSDFGARAVVVVNQVGKLRFTYKGHPSTTKVSFFPYGITTYSPSRTLTADRDNHRIHIIDQNGQFLRFIDNCQFNKPFGLCVDTSDNLFFGSLTSSLIESEKHGYKMDDPGVESSPSNKDLLHEPRVITQIKTEYAYTCNLSCLTVEDIWVRGNSNILKLYNL
ncbi:tripartite motif-containing protein 2-like [Magallana gigas]|uniref:tripartite motif-containing protein 2-like n=1 Tax=Magallana gigas TaxID=29159 RepID=UPI003342C7A5